MENAVRYINKICELYNLSEDTKKIMLHYIDKAIRLLGDFTWTEIESAIDWYYANRSQTKQPRLIELNSWLRGRKRPANRQEKEELPPAKPYTNIRLIQDVFYDICRTAHIQGVAGAYGFTYFQEVEKLPTGEPNAIIDKNGVPTLVMKRWYWEDAVNDAKQRFPERFEMFKHLTFWEECAIAYKLGVLRF